MITQASPGTQIVTGAATGIGRAIAHELARAGNRVIACDINEPDSEFEQCPGQIEFRRLDVTREDDWIQLAADVPAEVRVTGLVNNAGIGGADDVLATTEQVWDRVIAVNQTGVFLGMKHVGGRIERDGGGAIVNMSSIFSAVGGFGNAIAYHASKGAVVAMTKTAAVMWAKRGVRVNSVHPGFVATPMTLQHGDLDLGGITIAETIAYNTPMGRMATPEEIAHTVAFLLSDKSAFTTGSEFFVDGGWTAI